MPYHSKWQDLPTEAINPRRWPSTGCPWSTSSTSSATRTGSVVAAVHRERERIAHGVEIIVTPFERAAGCSSWAPARAAVSACVEAAEMPPTFGTPPKLVQAIMAGGQDAVFRRARASRTSSRKAPAASRASASPSGTSSSASPPAGSRSSSAARSPRPQEGRAHHLRHLLAGHRASELCRSDHRAGRRRRSHRRVDPPQGGHGHEDGAQHADDHRDDPRRQRCTAT